MGQGTDTMLAQIAADQFNVAPADIRVIAGDTAHVPMGHGGFASRQAVNAGNSVHLAARRSARRFSGSRPGFWETVEDLELDGRFVVSGPQPFDQPRRHRARGDRHSRLLPAEGDRARDRSGADRPFHATGLTYSNAAHAVELEVDPFTGAVRILRYVVVSDCGRQINPMIVDGQIIGGVVHGIGNALFERMIYDETAQPVSTNFAEYLLPTATELPRIELISMSRPPRSTRWASRASGNAA